MYLYKTARKLNVENDGTDSVCMKHAGHASAWLSGPNCQFDNYTSECHSLPGDDSFRKHFLRRRYRAVMDKRIVQTRLRAIQNVSR